MRLRKAYCDVVRTNPRRRIGSPPVPRRDLVPPAAVRFAQAALALRIGAVLALLVVGGRSAGLHTVEVSPTFDLTLPDAATWLSLAPWVVIASIVEVALVVGLGRLGSVCRRLVLVAESAVIAGCVLYAAAGNRAALAILVPAIAAVELLRVDSVRHSFNRAAAARRLVALQLEPVLYDGYEMPEVTAVKGRQLIGYRAWDDAAELPPPDRVKA
jgi:hypothetical protein